MKRVKRSKNQDERIVNDPFTNLANDMIIEILMKLRPRSIARLHFASKESSSIILDKKFIQWYMTRSLTQPRYLISLHGGGYMQMQLFQSLSQDHPYNHNMVSYEMEPDVLYEFTPPVRGLICGRDFTKMIVGNPCTGQFVSLPRVKTRRQDILSVFGYDPVNDVYKVLCMTVVLKRSHMSRNGNAVPWEDIVSEEHQVITLGAKEKWRMIDSEEFNVTKLPEDQMLQQYSELVNHAGKITIAHQAYNRNVDLWVLEDANKEVWSNFFVVPPLSIDFFGRFRDLVFMGILGTGEMIFASRSSPPFFFVCFDPKSKKGQRNCDSWNGRGLS
ncbi:hypothetical protein Bca4012_071743 [Brassica carinata]